MATSTDFYRDLPAFDRFAGVIDPANYRPFPDDWSLAVTDIVGSREAIADGRYKTVNFVGAAPIAAIGNALGDHHLPFVFGGDGCLVGIPPGREEAAREALAATAAWARRAFGSDLRVGLVRLSRIRQAGRDVRVARFQASPGISYAMFDGGGCQWAEAALKRGELDRLDGPDEAAPDLDGLSCRWQPLDASRGVIVSLIVETRDDAPETARREFVTSLLARLAELTGGNRLIPEDGPRFRWPPPRLAIAHEAKAAAGPDGQRRARRRIYLISAVARLLELFGLRLGGFDARRYRLVTGLNADFRKYQDGLRATIDCSEAEAETLISVLEEARHQGIIDFGLSRQGAALMTCIVPSPLSDDHAHFVDGAEGGYAAAASDLARRRAEDLRDSQEDS
ncbi:MAG: DUF3095 family protein [Azospirillaceae bacterium]